MRLYYSRINALIDIDRRSSVGNGVGKAHARHEILDRSRPCIDTTGSDGQTAG
jgi:hypothetical protein